jgi:hypothetical protein
MIARFLQLDLTPPFRRELTQIRWIGSLSGFRKYTVWMIGLVFVGAAILSLGMWYAIWEDYQPFNDEVFPYALPVFFAASLLLAISFYTSWIADLVTLFFGIGAIRREMDADRIDLLRVSSSEADIVQGKYALVMMRAWRVMSFWVALRMATVVLFVASGILLLMNRPLWRDLGIPPEIVGEIPIFLIIWVPITLLLAVFVILEHMLKMRVYAGLSLYISARVTGRVAGILLALVGVVVINMIISTVVSFFSFPLSIAFGFGSTYLEDNPDLIPIVARVVAYGIFPFLTILSAVVPFVGYRFIWQRLMQDTVRYLTNKL